MASCAGITSLKSLPHQMPIVRDMPTMVATDNKESTFDSGEGAKEMATTLKKGGRYATYPSPARGGSNEK